MAKGESELRDDSLVGRIRGRWPALIVAVLAGALIWAASPRLSGAAEPWDAESPYYVGALAFAGFVVGLLPAVETRRVRRMRPQVDISVLFVAYAGVFVGQLVYMIAFLPSGPFFAVGVFFLAAFSGVAAMAAAITDAFVRLS